MSRRRAKVGEKYQRTEGFARPASKKTKGTVPVKRNASAEILLNRDSIEEVTCLEPQRIMTIWQAAPIMLCESCLG